MTDAQDILNDIDDAPLPQRNDWYIALLAVWTLQNVIALALFFYSVQQMRIYYPSTVSIAALSVQFLTARGLPLVSLVLLWYRKKSGWWLTIICCVSVVVKMSPVLWQLLQSLSAGTAGKWLPFTGFVLIFVSSAVSLGLGLSNGLRRFFHLTRRQQVWAVVAGIFFVIVFNQLINIVLSIISSHSSTSGASF